MCRRIRGAFIKDHDDVRTQIMLDLHGFFRGEENLLAVDRVTEVDAFFFDLADIAQAEYLESAGIGQDRAVPVHEIVQITMFAHDVLPRAQPQVEGVSQQDLRAGVFYFFRCHAFDCAVGTHGHKRRRFYYTTIEDQATTTGTTFCFFQFKFHVFPFCQRNSLTLLFCEHQSTGSQDLFC